MTSTTNHSCAKEVFVGCLCLLFLTTCLLVGIYEGVEANPQAIPCLDQSYCQCYLQTAICSGWDEEGSFPLEVYSTRGAIRRLLLDSSFCGRIHEDHLIQSLPYISSITFTGQDPCQTCLHFPLLFHSTIDVYGGCLGSAETTTVMTAVKVVASLETSSAGVLDGGGSSTTTTTATTPAMASTPPATSISTPLPTPPPPTTTPTTPPPPTTTPTTPPPPTTTPTTPPPPTTTPTTLPPPTTPTTPPTTTPTTPSTTTPPTPPPTTTPTTPLPPTTMPTTPPTTTPSTLLPTTTPTTPPPPPTTTPTTPPTTTPTTLLPTTTPTTPPPPPTTTPTTQSSTRKSTTLKDKKSSSRPSSPARKISIVGRGRTRLVAVQGRQRGMKDCSGGGRAISASCCLYGRNSVCYAGGRVWPGQEEMSSSYTGKLYLLEIEQSACFQTSQAIDFDRFNRFFPASINTISFQDPDCSNETLMVPAHFLRRNITFLGIQEVIIGVGTTGRMTSTPTASTPFSSTSSTPSSTTTGIEATSWMTTEEGNSSRTIKASTSSAAPTTPVPNVVESGSGLPSKEDLNFAHPRCGFVDQLENLLRLPKEIEEDGDWEEKASISVWIESMLGLATAPWP